MRCLLITFCVVATLFSSCQTKTTTVHKPSASAEVAVKMRTYYLGLFKRGAKRGTASKEELMEWQKGHLANIERHWRDGKIILAGPTHPDDRQPGDPIIGVLLINVATPKEALALVDSDPLVRNEHLRLEVMRWYGPTGVTYPGDLSQSVRQQAKAAR